jgi:energy-coupling factor transporter transmembrane protein EcfT
MPGLFIGLGIVHPSLRIIALIALAVAIQFITPRLLLATGLLVMLSAFFQYPMLFRRVLFRSRWLLLTLLAIFAFTTPGEYVHGWSIAIAPTYEGISRGALQGGRLIIMLAGLTLLLGSTGREALMAGIYCLMQPFRLLGLSPLRFTARLWLTLHYVEQAPEKQHRSGWTMLQALALESRGDQPQTLVLTIPAWTPVDALVLCLAAVAALVGWLA